MSNQGVMRIGEVHAQLRQDFPDIELSKIRYYEDKGLVQPSRSRKGYRLYSERDVDCLREAIRLAQEEFVPLRVVRLRLIEQGLLKDLPVPSSPRHAAREATANVVSIPAPGAEGGGPLGRRRHDDRPAVLFTDRVRVTGGPRRHGDRTPALARSLGSGLDRPPSVLHRARRARWRRRQFVDGARRRHSSPGFATSGRRT
jgi:DNA-binding transcriptional MerR regulator